jgi:hypothetical protein
LKKLFPEKQFNSFTPEKLEEFLKVVRADASVKMLSAPRVTTRDGEDAVIKTGDIEFRIKNNVQPDRKLITAECRLQYTCGEKSGDKKSNEISTKVTLPSNNAIVVRGGEPCDGNEIILIVQPKILEANDVSRKAANEKTIVATHSTGFDKLTTGGSGQGEIKQADGFRATLANGTMVELLGVCEHPSKGKQWWKPDGKPLDFKIETDDKSNYKSKDPGYEFVYKTSGGIEKMLIGEKDSTTSSNIEVLEPKGLFVGRRAHIKAGTKTIDIKINYVLDGAVWNTIAEHNGQGTTFRNVNGGKVIFSQANDTPDGLLITVTDDLGIKQADRLIVVDKSGKENRAQLQTSLMVNEMRQQTFIVKEVNAKDAVNFKFQQIPYQQITFKNVSLKPNK